MEWKLVSPLLYLLIWLQYYCTLSFSILNPIDFLALQAIRESLDDVPGSHFFHSWDFTSDPCRFPGVSCTADKVSALNLGDPWAGSPGLTGRIHPSLGFLSSLTEFTIVPGRVRGPIPETIFGLTSLRFFGVTRNFLSGEIPTVLGNLTALQTLDLSNNQLTGSIPGSLGSLPALSNLMLSHNHLTGPVPSFGSGSVSRIDLMHNNLSGLIAPDSFPPSLEYLSLGWNQFCGPVDRLFSRMNQLKYLDLSKNQFTGIIPCPIFQLPDLTNLYLQRNMFFGPVSPEDKVTITTVDLSYNRLSGEISPLLSTVQNLYLNTNRFMGQVPASFVDRLLDGTIQVLYLQHNFLTGINQMSPTAEIPLTSSLCLQYNCMVPPIQTPCPLKAGSQKTRPTTQCIGWQG